MDLRQCDAAIEDVAKRCDYNHPGAACLLFDAITALPDSGPSLPDKDVVLAYTRRVQAQVPADPALRKDAADWAQAWHNIVLFPERMEAWRKVHPESTQREAAAKTIAVDVRKRAADTR
jgi:hypothetical protein